MIHKDRLVGKLPVVEYRASIARYFVTFPEIARELVMSFECKYAAREIAANTYAGTPFFDMIPTVDHGTSYPRPNLLYPTVDLSVIDLVIRD